MKTSINHLLALPIALLLTVLLKATNWFEWNDLQYNDNWFGWEFQTHAIVPQTIIVLVLSIVFAGFFEYFQQRNLTEKPSRKDTIRDIIVSAVSAYIGYIIASILFV
jgi:F0F1-type ATP synthase membrane subunit a